MVEIWRSGVSLERHGVTRKFLKCVVFAVGFTGVQVALFIFVWELRKKLVRGAGARGGTDWFLDFLLREGEKKRRPPWQRSSWISLSLLMSVFLMLL